MIPTLADFARWASHRVERQITAQVSIDAAMGYYDEADKAHEAGNLARERYLRLWGDRTALEAQG